MSTTHGHLPRRLRNTLLGLAVMGVGSCEQVEQVQDRFRDMTPYEAYQASLELAGLGGTALGQAWAAAGTEAVERPLPVSLPYQETGYIAPEDPRAIGYLVSVPRGRRLTAEVALDTQEGTRVFVDLFRVAEDEDDPARPLISTDSVPGVFTHEPWREGEFVLRLQPELLRGGRYTVTLRLEAQLSFPVEGHGVRSVWSRFGVDRDGGRRSHHGIDIFAPRGTPVLAASEGVVNRVEVTNLGGKVVWVRDAVRNANLYYAHLDSQAVQPGQRVSPGDTVGFVGNTGNAVSTPPHLHFGLYRRGEGPVDPFPFVEPPPSFLPELTADLELLGRWVRAESEGLRVREAPTARGRVLAEVERHTLLRVLGGSAEYFRVRLPDGSHGFVMSRLTEPAERPVAEQIASATLPVRVGPDQDARVMATLVPGEGIPVLGRFGPYLFVRTPGGHEGWVETDLRSQ